MYTRRSIERSLSPLEQGQKLTFFVLHYFPFGLELFASSFSSAVKSLSAIPCGLCTLYPKAPVFCLFMKKEFDPSIPLINQLGWLLFSSAPLFFNQFEIRAPRLPPCCLPSQIHNSIQCQLPIAYCQTLLYFDLLKNHENIYFFLDRKKKKKRLSKTHLFHSWYKQNSGGTLRNNIPIIQVAKHSVRGHKYSLCFLRSLAVFWHRER